MSLAATATMVLMLLLLSGFWIIQTGLLAGLEFVEQKVEVVADLKTKRLERQIAALRRGCGHAGGRRRDLRQQGGRARALPRDRSRPRARRTSPATSTRTRSTRASRSSCAIRTTSATSVDALREEPAVESVKDIQKLVDRVLTVTGILRTGGRRRARSSSGSSCCSSSSTRSGWPSSRGPRRSRSCGWSAPPTRSSAGRSSSRARWSACSGRSLTLVVLAVAADPIGRFMFEFFRVLPLQLGSLSAT